MSIMTFIGEVANQSEPLYEIFTTKLDEKSFISQEDINYYCIEIISNEDNKISGTDFAIISEDTQIPIGEEIEIKQKEKYPLNIYYTPFTDKGKNDIKIVFKLKISYNTVRNASRITKIRQKTMNNSFNEYYLSMDADNVTIQSDIDKISKKGDNIETVVRNLKDYTKGTIYPTMTYNFTVDYTTNNAEGFNTIIKKDATNNAEGLRNILINIPNNSSNLKVVQYSANNFTNASRLLEQSKVQSIDTINIKPTSASYMFNSCYYLSDINNLSLGNNLTNISNMFLSCKKLVNINNIDIGVNVTDASSMFLQCTNLKNIPNFYTTSVTNFKGMFDSTRIKTLPNIDTSNGQDMSRMFYGCYILQDINNLNTINATDMSSMFSICPMLVNIPNLNISNAINIRDMFRSCNNLITVPDFNTVNVVDMSGLFSYCNNLTDAPNLNTASVINIDFAYSMCNNLINVPEFNSSNITSMNNMFYKCTNLSEESLVNICNSLPEYSQIINPTSNILSYIGLSFNQMNIILNNSTLLNLVESKGWTVIKTVNYSMKYTNISSTSTWINFNINNIPMSTNASELRNEFKSQTNVNVSNIHSLNVISLPRVIDASYLFSNTSNYRFNNLTNITSLNLYECENLSYLFYYDNQLKYVNNINIFNAINMSSMFYWCNNLINVSNFNTSNAIDMSEMFYACRNLTNVPNFNTINVKSFKHMLYCCHNLTNVPNFNTSNATDIGGMFYYCNKLINIPNLDTSNATNMSYMFGVCNNLVNIPIFNTSSVNKSMLNMFQYCSNLSNTSLENIAYSLPYYDNITGDNSNKKRTLDYIGLTASQINNLSANAINEVERKGWLVNPSIRIDYSFTNGFTDYTKINISGKNGESQYNSLMNEVINIKSIECPTMLNISGTTNNISNMWYLFQDFNLLTNVNLYTLNTSQVTNFSGCFESCSNLTTVSNINMFSAKNAESMFKYCSNLINVPFLSYMNACNNTYNMFYGCRNLLNIPYNSMNLINVTNMYGMFRYCNNLTTTSLENIIDMLPNANNIINISDSGTLAYLGLTSAQINSLSNMYKQKAADKGWLIPGFSKEMGSIVRSLDISNAIIYNTSEAYPMYVYFNSRKNSYCLKNKNQGVASSNSSASFTVTNDIINIYGHEWKFDVYYSSESGYDYIIIDRNGTTLCNNSGSSSSNYLLYSFTLNDIAVNDTFNLRFRKDGSADSGLDGCEVYISGERYAGIYEVSYSLTNNTSKKYYNIIQKGE